MNEADLLLSPASRRSAESDYCADSCQVKAQHFVGEGLQPMTDEEREAAAYRAGVAMQAWYSQYQQTGNPSHLDRAYHHLGQMRALLAGRSKAQIARMEQERGIA